MGKGLTAFFLGKTNRPPSLDFCVLALDIAGFTEPRRNITKGAAYKPPAPEVFVPAFTAWPAALRRPAPPATLAQRPTLN